MIVSQNYIKIDMTMEIKDASMQRDFIRLLQNAGIHSKCKDHIIIAMFNLLVVVITI